MNNNDRSEVQTLSGLNFLLGAWLIISPYVINYTSSSAKWNQTIFGIVVVILSAIRFFAPLGTRSASFLNGLSGIWMIIAPFILNYATSTAYWNEIVVGAVIAFLAFWNSSIYLPGSGGQAHRAGV